MVPTSPSAVLCRGADHPAIHGLHRLVRTLLGGIPCALRTIRSEAPLGTSGDGETTLYLRSASVVLIPALLQQTGVPRVPTLHLRGLLCADRQWRALGCVAFDSALEEPHYLPRVLAEEHGLSLDGQAVGRAEALHAAWRETCARYDHPLAFLQAVSLDDVPLPAEPGQLYRAGAWGPACLWLWSGWCAPEHWGCRTLGHRAVLGIPVSQSELGPLTLVCRCRDLTEASNLSVLVDGMDVPFRIEAGEASCLLQVALPTETPHPGLREVEFRQSTLRPKVNHEASGDRRLRGLGLLDLRLERGAPWAQPARPAAPRHVLLIGCGLRDAPEGLAQVLPPIMGMACILQVELASDLPSASDRLAAACLGMETKLGAVFLYRLGREAMAGGLFDSHLLDTLSRIMVMVDHIAGSEASAADVRSVLATLKTLPAMRDRGVVLDGTAWHAQPGID